MQEGGRQKILDFSTKTLVEKVRAASAFKKRKRHFLCARAKEGGKSPQVFFLLAYAGKRGGATVDKKRGRKTRRKRRTVSSGFRPVIRGI